MAQDNPARRLQLRAQKSSSNRKQSIPQPRFFYCYFFILRIAVISKTRTISQLQHRRESFALCIITLLCGTYQPRLCTLELLPKEFNGGSLIIRTTSTHLRSINNSATHFTDLGRMEGWVNLVISLTSPSQSILTPKCSYLTTIRMATFSFALNC